MDKNYLKLLEKRQELHKIGKYLTQKEEKEFLNYQIRILDHFRWEQKNNYIQVMIDFLKNTIDLDQYIDKFYEIDSKQQKSQEKLKSNFTKLQAFNPDLRSKGFAILIENLFSDIRILEIDDELRVEGEISEKDLRDGIKEFLSKMQEY